MSARPRSKRTSNDPEKAARQLANLKRGGDPGPGRPPSHGAFARVSQSHLNAKTREIVEALQSDAPVRAGDGGVPAADGVAIKLLADALCRLDSIAEYLDRKGWEGEDGKPRPVLDHEPRIRAHALELLRELGMTPASRAKLGLDLARTRQVTLQDFIDGTEAP